MSDTTSPNGRNFEEALEVLDEASRDKKEEIQKLLTERFTNLKTAVTELADSQRETIQTVKRLAEETFGDGGETIRKMSSDLEKKIKENPWAVIGGVAAGALVLGYLIGTLTKPQEDR